MDTEDFPHTRATLLAKLEPKLSRYYEPLEQLGYLQKLPDPVMSGTDLIKRRIRPFEVLKN